jgi:Holliday junction resolvasome RuvABC ATP-dependent DNA helicase subunit
MSDQEKDPVEEFILPIKPTKSKLKNPSPLLIFGKPKIGKTTTLGGLENNLIINLEDKVQTADGMIMYAPDLTSLRTILLKIKQAGNPYKYLTIDTLN